MVLAAAVVIMGALTMPGLTLASDLRVMLAEDWGRTLALASLVPALVAIDSRDRRQARRLAILAGIFLGSAAGTHLVAALGAAVLIAGLGIGRAIMADRLRSASVAVLTVAVVAITVEGAVLLTAPGELGFQAAAGDDRYDGLREELGKPGSFDPVVFLVTEGHPERLAVVPRGPLAVLETLGRKLVTSDQRSEEAAGPLPLLIAGALFMGSMIVVLSVTNDRRLRALAVGSTIALLAFTAITVAFAARFDTFALSNFGPRRLSQYIGLVGLVLLAGAAEAIVSRSPPRAATGIGVVIAVIAGVAVLPFSLAEPRPKARGDLAALAWIAENVPCEGRVLLDRRTLASVESLTGRAGVLEGMGPHLRPPLLVRAIDEMEQAKRFLSHPNEGADYLRSRGIAAVVVTEGIGMRLGGWPRLAASDPARLAELPFLTEAFHADGVTIFAVDGWTDSTDLPRMRGRPGYSC